MEPGRTAIGRPPIPPYGCSPSPTPAPSARWSSTSPTGQALQALEAVGAANLAGKVVLDVGLPLDFSDGMPAMLTIANDDSLAEQIQRAYPEAQVVKSLNTVYIAVMVAPSRVPGEHTVFVAGDDDSAKDVVRGLLGELGWPARSVLDLGNIRGARGAEMYSRLYFELVAALGTFDVNIAVVHG